MGWLVLASFVFYGWWNPVLLPLLLGSIAVNYVFGRVLLRNRRKSLLVLGVAFNLGLLGFFKYTDFLIGTVNATLATAMPLQHILLPLAISFFTFQQIAYLVDVHKGGTTDPDLLHYCLFVSFFPQLIAGPIVHHGEMIPQFQRAGVLRFDGTRLAVGMTIFIIGLYKKAILADGIAPYADRVFDAAATATPGLIEAWSGALAYTFQIYFDFSGYSDMAVGIAFALGIRLPLNFNSPYKATSIIEFWRRWHMTLSRFLRDYLYVPLGGNRKGRSRRHVNLMAAMLIGGLWHGAGWNFVMWGGLHGAYLVINHAGRAARKRLGLAPDTLGRGGAILGGGLTFVAVVVAWVFFRAPDLATAWSMLAGMIDLASLPPAAELGAALAASGYVWIAAMAAIVWLAPNAPQLFADRIPVIDERGRELAPLGGNGWALALAHRAAWLAPAAVVMGSVAALIVIARGSDAAQFIYMVF